MFMDKQGQKVSNFHQHVKSWELCCPYQLHSYLFNLQEGKSAKNLEQMDTQIKNGFMLGYGY